ncbi:MAG: permease, partial [Candidatus Jacksonbacteria bacterium]|nr:permease [Candidatus Jacksonbacteria bacterium]
MVGITLAATGAALAVILGGIGSILGTGRAGS